MTTKSDARLHVKTIRSAMPAQEAAKLSELIEDKVLASMEYNECNTLYIYKSVNNEVDTDKIIHQALLDGKVVALPRVIDGDIFFYQIEDICNLEYGYMGIPEPEPNPERLVDTDTGLVITPGLAFDIRCCRTGYGRGYYDRFFASHRGLVSMGLAFEYQMFEELEVNQLDIPLNMVVTEERIQVS